MIFWQQIMYRHVLMLQFSRIAALGVILVVFRLGGVTGKGFAVAPAVFADTLT